MQFLPRHRNVSSIGTPLEQQGALAKELWIVFTKNELQNCLKQLEICMKNSNGIYKHFKMNFLFLEANSHIIFRNNFFCFSP